MCTHTVMEDENIQSRTWYVLHVKPRTEKLMSGDVNITFGTAMKLAKALEMDFFPTLTPRDKTAAEKGVADA